MLFIPCQEKGTLHQAYEVLLLNTAAFPTPDSVGC